MISIPEPAPVETPAGIFYMPLQQPQQCKYILPTKRKIYFSLFYFFRFPVKKVESFVYT